MMGKHFARGAVTGLAILLAGPALAQAPAGGVDVQFKMDNLIESYSVSKNTLAFLLRDVTFGYELAGTGRGTLSAEKFAAPRKEVDIPIQTGREPRGIIITKAPDNQPILNIRMSGQKKDVVVKGKFIRSDWNMLSTGRDVTIFADAEGSGIVPVILRQAVPILTTEVTGNLKAEPRPAIEPLTLRTSRTDGDQLIIKGNKMGFSITYPSVMATYSSEMKAAP